MEHLDLGDVEVTYELRGAGEPIVFLHASAFVPLYRPVSAHLVRAVANTDEVINAHLEIVATYERGDRRAAMDQFMRHVFGDGYRRVLDAAVPEAFDEAVAEADLLFHAELGALRQWESARATPPRSTNRCSTSSGVAPRQDSPPRARCCSRGASMPSGCACPTPAT